MTVAEQAEKRVVAVISIGDRPWIRHNLPTVERYARRCGAEFRLINHLPGPEVFPFPDLPDTPGRPHKRVYAAKSFVPWSLIRQDGFERVLMLDDTCVVSPTAPDIFDMVPENHCGYTKTNRAHAMLSFEEIGKFTAARGLAKVPLDHEKYMNSGVVLYDRRFIGALDRRKILAAEDLLYARYPHQTLLYYLLAAAKVKMQRLPGAFNAIPRDAEDTPLNTAASVPDGLKPAYIYHVTGGFKHRREIIEGLVARIDAA